MPQLSETDYSEFNRILEELKPELGSFKPAEENFVNDMVEKNGLYGEGVFVSPKQFAWLKRIHQEYVGDTDFEVGDIGSDGPGDPRDRDGW